MNESQKQASDALSHLRSEFYNAACRAIYNRASVFPSPFGPLPLRRPDVLHVAEQQVALKSMDEAAWMIGAGDNKGAIDCLTELKKNFDRKAAAYESSPYKYRQTDFFGKAGQNKKVKNKEEAARLRDCSQKVANVIKLL